MKDYGILFVDDDKAILDLVNRYLSREGYAVSLADSGRKALHMLKEKDFDIIFTDFKMPEIDGIELLSAIKEYRPDTEVIIVTGHGTMETAVKAMKIGSYDYLQKPFKLDLLKLIIDRIVGEKLLKDKRALLKSRIKERHRYDSLVGISLGMQEIYEIIDRMKNTGPNVLIRGESGTGKELTARVIHRSSDRNHRPLIPIVCRTFLRGLSGDDAIQHLSELLASADGSTLYLDEITDISLPVQKEFLRLLDEKTNDIEPIEDGFARDIRVIAAMGKDLRDAIEGDMVSRDFLNRVSAVSIKMPPLRERKEDICLLVNHFLHKYNADSARKVYTLEPEALSYLLQYHWPGNVIQLENVIERAFALGAEIAISVSDLPMEIKTFGDISKSG
ncbi:MAG: sigma-54 dependent transcriptional regulator [Desulfobacterales bacterium]|nr:sigma-54 dependent transcriptional regulator [Desulfobacterales bacterium]